ncbi:uncharacterized protein [Eleutherodactylus coqui]|uniref:uncharacterized protein isoform X3 n=1 Tax=Eleutherodactylus coqui TaxID=57060 RepID=UPI003461FA25
MSGHTSPLGRRETRLLVQMMDQLDYDGHHGPYQHPHKRKQKIMREFGTERSCIQLQKWWSNLKLKDPQRLEAIRLRLHCWEGDATQGHRADSGEEHHPSPAREPTPPPEATQEEAVAQDPPATATTSAEGSPWSLPSLVEVERPSLDPGRPVTVWRDVPRDERVAWFFHEIRLCHLQIDFLQSGLDGLRKRLANLHQWGVHHFQTMETRSLHRQASSSQSQSPPSPLDLSRT